MAGSLSLSVLQGSGTMHIELRRGLLLYPGTFNAVVAPEKMMAAAINNNVDLQRFLFLYIGGNYSRILPGINRASKNFDVRRGFTAHQLLTILREAAHTVVVIEHDPTLYDDAMGMLDPLSGMLKDLSRESLVILYTPGADRTFLSLAQRADRYIEFIPDDGVRVRHPSPRLMRQCGIRPAFGQQTLETA